MAQLLWYNKQCFLRWGAETAREMYMISLGISTCSVFCETCVDVCIEWLTSTIPANLLGGLSTKYTRLEWSKKAIFMSPRPHWYCTRPGQARGGSALLSKKTGTEGPDKVGSAGERGFTRMRARLWGQDRTPLRSPKVEVVNHHYTC